jgi:D-alanine-D-alanine ligase
VPLRVTILYNDDSAHAHGEAIDALAVLAVVEAAQAVAASCRKGGYETELVAAPTDPAGLLAAVARARGGVLFNLVEALGGDPTLEPAVASLFELEGVVYTGSAPRAILVGLEKPLARAVLAARGVPIPAGTLLERGDEPIAGAPPYIVKPSREDASHGISTESVVPSEAAARERARYVREKYLQAALVEEFVDGREFNITVLGEGDDLEVLSPGEIDYAEFPAGKPRLVTYEAKWLVGSPEYLGTRSVGARGLDGELGRRVAEIARAAYRAVGLRDYGRVDIRLHLDGGPRVLEVNPNPDVSPGGGVSLAAARSGIDYDALIWRIVRGAVARLGAHPPDARSR